MPMGGLVKRMSLGLGTAGLLWVLGVGALSGQEPLEVGTVAPDFALVGATRDGVVPDTVRLSDFAGKNCSTTARM
jgi:hypothetical protein